LALSADGSTLAVGAPGEQNSAQGINALTDDNDTDNSGSVYVFVESDGTWSQQAYIKASNTGENDEFGSAISLSSNGDRLIVGAVGEASSATVINGDQTNNDAASAGAAYVFDRVDSSWSQTAYLKASNAEAGDGFGNAVSISQDGSTIAIGASGEDGNSNVINNSEDNNNALLAGAAYVFVNIEGQWQQQAYIKSDNSDPRDAFGTSLDLSADGNVLVVGATGESNSAMEIDPQSDDNSDEGSGAVYLFTRDELSEWTQNHYFKAESSTETQFGLSVSLSDNANLLVIGAGSEQVNSVGVDGTNIADNELLGGAAYVFSADEDFWTQTAFVRSPIPSANDRCAESVDLSSDGESLAMGCWGSGDGVSGISTNARYSESSLPSAGSVFLY